MTEQQNDWVAEACRTMTELKLLAVILLTATEPAEA